MQLWKHPNKKWYILYGERLKRRLSTGTGDRAEAEVKLAQFIAGSREPVLDAVTVKTILKGYEADRKGVVRAPNSLKFGVAALNRLIGNLGPAQLTPKVLGGYSRDRGASAGTILREIGVLRAALSWAHQHKLIEAVPQIPNPVKAPPPRERWLTKEEAQALLAACKEPHVKLFIIMGLMTAARSGAIFELKWSQVDLARKRIDFGHGHGNKRRAPAPINPQALKALTAAKEMACSDYVIEFRGERVKTIKTGFAAACRRANLQGVTPHILRHTAATWAAMEGRPLQEIARLLGDSLATVERVYAKWTPDYLADTVSALQLPKAGKKRLTGARHKRNKVALGGNES